MSKTIIFGIDGLSYELTIRLFKDGMMPQLKRFEEAQSFRRMYSSLPDVSSTAWASIVTGVDPGWHNIYGFTDLMQGQYLQVFTSSRTFKEQPFWQREDGCRNLVINVPMSYPAQPMNGLLISGFVALDLAKGVYPSEEYNYLAGINYIFDVDSSIVAQSRSDFYDELDRVLTIRREALFYLWEKEPWDRIMFVVTGTDRLNHHCWDDLEGKDSLGHSRFLEFYGKVDVLLGEVLDRAEAEGDRVVLVSDHGFEAQHVTANMNAFLAEAGFLSLPEGEKPVHRDMGPKTRAFAMDPGRIYLHYADRYPQGGVQRTEANELIQQIRTALEGWSIQGKPVVEKIFFGAEIYQGPQSYRAPDLVVLGGENIALSGRLQRVPLIEDNRLSGKHRWDDAVFAVLPPLPSPLPERIVVEDVLALAGV